MSIHLAIGDFEGNSPEILQRVGVDKPEFDERCRHSLNAFRAALPDNIPLSLSLFEKEWANSRWQHYLDEAHKRLMTGDFGKVKEFTGQDPECEIIRFIMKSSRSFYEYWYNRTFSDEELRQLILRQAAEYAAFGRVVLDDFGSSPTVVVMGDRPKMAALVQMNGLLPTLSAKRIY